MNFKSILKTILCLIIITSFSSCNENTQNSQNNKIAETDPLPSWNDGPSKNAIINYVLDVTNKESENFIPIPERISTFDNDGTLWSEQPAYFQMFFAMDRIKELAVDHPEWKTEQPFKAALDNDMEALAEQGYKGLIQLLMVSHTGSDSEEFNTSVKNWIQTAKHPTKEVSYDKLVFQPMLELLDYLRANNFKTYIVSGGGIDFMRAIVTEIYGIPEEQIIGSRIKTSFDYNNGDPRIIRLAEVENIDDKDGKPLNIQKIIGKKPVFAAGNSDGDIQMLQWTDSNTFKSLKILVHHTDSIREWAYDRDSHIGRLDKGIEESKAKGWNLVDMKSEWKVIYPYELEKN
jgi:phosphoglycolate phosphatase-like HAD superfamily hydrolase